MPLYQKNDEKNFVTRGAVFGKMTSEQVTPIQKEIVRSPRDERDITILDDIVCFPRALSPDEKTRAHISKVSFIKKGNSVTTQFTFFPLPVVKNLRIVN